MGKPTKIFIVLLGIMLLFTVISRSAASFTVAQVRIEQPQARKIEHKVTGDGTVEKLLDQAVYAPADILVAKVNVRKGQNVKKGQTLAVLDMDSLKDKIRTFSDDIEILQLQNDALLSAEAKKNSDRGGYPCQRGLQGYGQKQCGCRQGRKERCKRYENQIAQGAGAGI